MTNNSNNNNNEEKKSKNNFVKLLILIMVVEVIYFREKIIPTTSIFTATTTTTKIMMQKEQNKTKMVQKSYYYNYCNNDNNTIDENDDCDYLNNDNLENNNNDNNDNNNDKYYNNVNYYCLDNLGKNGTWIQNWTFAKLYGQYQKPLASDLTRYANNLINRFVPSDDDAPFRWETSWVWHDYYYQDNQNNNNNNNDKNNDNSVATTSSSCQIDYTISGQDFCDLLIDKLHIDRIFFFGDSMAVSQYSSLVAKLGPDYILNKDTAVGSDPPAYRSVLHCKKRINNNNNNNDTIIIKIPIGAGKETGGKAFAHTPDRIVKFSNETRAFLQANDNNDDNNNNYNPPIYVMGKPIIQDPMYYSSFFNSSNHHHHHHRRSLIILNLGAHYHDISTYTRDIKLLLFDYIQNVTTPQDIVFFRTTVSGHVNCIPTNPKTFNWTKGTRIVPISNYATEYTQTTKYEWHLFDTFNAITKELIMSVKKNNWFMLDVYNMTILRHDGHSGGNDCLHYLKPGPLDWWNHLLYTHLKYRQFL